MNEGPEGSMCGRPPDGKALIGSGGLVECEHVSGLLMRDTGPLALMSSANEIPYRSSRFDAQLPKAGSSRRRIDRVTITSSAPHQFKPFPLVSLSEPAALGTARLAP
jgi:hypothetical protein